MRWGVWCVVLGYGAGECAAPKIRSCQGKWGNELWRKSGDARQCRDKPGFSIARIPSTMQEY